MSRKGWKADDLQIDIDLRAVVDHLQLLPIEGCLLIASQPLGIHIWKKAAKGAADQFLTFMVSGTDGARTGTKSGLWLTQMLP